MGSPVGVIYGTASSTRFDVAVHDTLRRLDYVAVEHEGHQVLCQVEDVVRRSGLDFEEAVSGAAAGEDRLSAQVQAVGFLDGGRVETPRTPFAAGQCVVRAPEDLVASVLGLEPGHDGAYIGTVAGSRTPVRLSMNMLAQKHVSVLAKTGAGKSYTVGVLLEEFLSAGVPLLILDPHGEYGALRHANIDPQDVAAMAQQGLKPRSFAKQITERALDTQLNPDSEPLRLEGINLEAREIVDLVGGKLSGGQVGLLYQAVKEVKESMPGYALQDVMEAVQRNKSSAKWNVINALEALEGTGVFHLRGTPAKDLVAPGRCTIINLKGVAPDVQEVAVTRLVGLLWEARKRGEVPPFILVCEEAHNFCPERGVGTAVSGPVLRTVASEGRKFGMGLVIVSQRPAKVDKNVLSQCNTQFVLKVTNPNDLKAIISSVEGITSKAGDEVQRLPVGTALVAGGSLTQPVFVDVRPRLTRHGGGSVDVVQDVPQARPRTSRGAAPAPAPDTAALQAASQAPASRRAPVEPQEAEPAATAVARAAAPAQDPMPRAHSPSARTGRVHTQHRQSSRIIEKLARDAPAPSREHADGAPAEPPTRRSATTTDGAAAGIHRVATRVGLVTGQGSAEETIELIERLARRNGRDPAARIGMYTEIARSACHEADPHCIRCPVATSCQHHEALRTERKKSRAAIRRLWTR